MTQTQAQPCIKAEDFVEQMQRHWVDKLGNVSSDALRQVWWQLCQAFNMNIHHHSTPGFSNQWIVVNPPTGSGKTQGAVVYCSMLSELPENEHPGVLIVTRFKAEADMLAEQINELSGRQVAVAHHSDSDTKLDRLWMSPVVIITHRAYELALDYLGQDASIQKTWPFFHTWNSTGRKLVIIDEALDLVDHSQIDIEDLKQTEAVIPESVQAQFPDEMKIVRMMIQLLRDMTKLAKGQTRPEKMLLKKKHELLSPLVDFTELRTVLRQRVRFHRKSAQENTRLRELHDQRLRQLQNLLQSFLYYSKVKGQHTLNTAQLLLPDGVKGAVIMDATAQSNVVYQLFNEAVLWEAPTGSRNYQKVTIHVARGHRTGKDYLSHNAKERCTELITDLNTRLTPSQEVFLVCHKDVEDKLEGWNVPFTMKVGHWGNVDGSNQWRDCDTCVVFGLPYRPDTWTANTFMAYQGPQDTEWLTDPEYRQFKDYQDVRQAMKLGQITSEVVQAINRVRCRKVIDAEGNCEATEVYLMLPNGDTAQQILEGIKREMPGVNIVEDWDLTSDGKAKVRRSGFAEALVRYCRNMGVATVSKSQMADELGCGSTQMDALTAAAQDTGSELHQRLAEAGVVVVKRKEGRLYRVYFVKDWRPGMSPE